MLSEFETRLVIERRLQAFCCAESHRVEPRSIQYFLHILIHLICNTSNLIKMLLITIITQTKKCLNAAQFKII